GRVDIGTHGGNLAALDEHVGLLEVADGAVEAEHAATFDQDRPPRRGCAARLLRTGRACDSGDHRRSSGCARGGGAEELAARQRCIACTAGAGRGAGKIARHGVLPNAVVVAAMLAPFVRRCPSWTDEGLRRRGLLAPAERLE